MVSVNKIFGLRTSVLGRAGFFLNTTCTRMSFLSPHSNFYSSCKIIVKDAARKHVLAHSSVFLRKYRSWKTPSRHFSSNDKGHFNDNLNDQGVTIEVALIAFMDKWEMEKAVKFFKKSVENGKLPNPTVVLNLLQQLGNLGDFECLFSLREVLMDNKLCSKDNFFACLNEAYHNSGRIEEAVLLLRMLYHDIRNYEDVDIFFTLVGIMLLNHFPNRFDLLESFAIDCRLKEPPDYLPTAGLWKCLVLVGSFDEANKILNENSAIRQHVPKMINEIASRKNKVKVNRTEALSWLSQLPPDVMKEKLLCHVMVELVKELGRPDLKKKSEKSLQDKLSVTFCTATLKSK